MSKVDIKKVTVIGAGDMGHGIAEISAIAGFSVCMYDIKQEYVNRGKSRILESLEKLSKKGKIPADLVENIKNNLLTTSTDMEEALADADLVIEAVPEIMELKKKVFSEIDAKASKNALLASNTSTMSISEIAAVTGRESQVFGLHFFNPVLMMRLVEVIKTTKCSNETIQAGLNYVERIQKLPVIAKLDTPGFIANRVNAAPTVLIGAMLERGEITPMELDATVRKLGAPMGPCELGDYVGLDIGINSYNYFAQSLHQDYAPPPHLTKMVQAGNLGKKTGKGYFDWSQGRPKIDFSQANDKFNPIYTVFVQVNEATKIVEQGVCSVNDVDLALINASGNPVGPMSIGRQFSKWDLCTQLEILATKYDKEIFMPTKLMREGGHKH